MSSSKIIFQIFTGMILMSGLLSAPTSYDQRQDGVSNYAADFENILIVVAIPSPSGAKSHSENGELSSYLTLLSEDATANSGQYAEASVPQDSKLDNTEEDDAVEIPEDDEDPLKEIEPKSSVKQGYEAGDKSSKTGSKSSRTLWSQVDDVVDNRQGSSLKKELSWGQDEDAVANIRDDKNHPNDHNEVGLIPTSRLTLLGTAIEDCGPERRRDSYGICQSFPTE